MFRRLCCPVIEMLKIIPQTNLMPVNMAYILKSAGNSNYMIIAKLRFIFQFSFFVLEWDMCGCIDSFFSHVIC